MSDKRKRRDDLQLTLPIATLVLRIAEMTLPAHSPASSLSAV